MKSKKEIRSSSYWKVFIYSIQLFVYIMQRLLPIHWEHFKSIFNFWFHTSSQFLAMNFIVKSKLTKPLPYLFLSHFYLEILFFRMQTSIGVTYLQHSMNIHCLNNFFLANYSSQWRKYTSSYSVYSIMFLMYLLFKTKLLFGLLWWLAVQKLWALLRVLCKVKLIQPSMHRVY